MVQKGIKFLEIDKPSRREGSECLVALACLKAGLPASHPKIQKGAASGQRLAKALQSGGGTEGYAEAVACMLLCELDSDRYSKEIGIFRADILKEQLSNGSWAYRQSGINMSDTSLALYDVLALWVTSEHGYGSVVKPIARACEWLIKTQTQDGGFCYQPHMSSNNPTLSMTTAGLGCLYLTAHLVGYGAEEEKEDGLPPALVRVKDKSELPPDIPGISAASIQRSCAAGDAWVSRNFKPTNSDARWTFYYLYSLERYMSFRDLVMHKKDPSPSWYNAGAAYLQKEQKNDGSWGDLELAGDIDTSLAILFLVRSTQKSIKAGLEEGILIGGKGLPKVTTNIQMRDGKVVTPQMVQDVDDLLDIIKSADNAEFDATELPGGLTLDDDLTKRTSQLERLRQMVSDEDFNARLAAVKTLARARQLDNVPALIYALSDPNPMIVREARDGLRFISRRFFGFNLPDNPSKDQAQVAQRKWEDWYLAIRPDGELLE